MIQKYSDLRVLEVFFKEPTAVHFIREISREIKLAPPSVKIIIRNLLEQGLIKPKRSKPFDGYVADRENDYFLFYKRAYNLLSLYDLRNLIIEVIHPISIILFGSYSRGEDIETSDMDIMVISKAKKELEFPAIEKKLKRKINIMIIEDLKKLDSLIVDKIHNGIVLYGGV
jgi:predicted nucleotidyltransferase